MVTDASSSSRASVPTGSPRRSVSCGGRVTRGGAVVRAGVVRTLFAGVFAFVFALGFGFEAGGAAAGSVRTGALDCEIGGGGGGTAATATGACAGVSGVLASGPARGVGVGVGVGFGFGVGFDAGCGASAVTGGSGDGVPVVGAGVGAVFAGAVFAGGVFAGAVVVFAGAVLGEVASAAARASPTVWPGGGASGAGSGEPPTANAVPGYVNAASVKPAARAAGLCRCRRDAVLWDTRPLPFLMQNVRCKASRVNTRRGAR
jgi:hypothetical protein